jgi:hypothetical protein
MNTALVGNEVGFDYPNPGVQDNQPAPIHLYLIPDKADNGEVQGFVIFANKPQER